MKQILILTITLAFLASCASNSASNNRVKNLQVSKQAKKTLANKDSDEKVICKQQRRIGSNRITTVCLSESETKAIREATHRELRRGARSGPSGEGAGK